MTDELIKKIVRELKNTYGTFTWWIDNDHSIEVEIPPELFEVLTQSLQKYGDKVAKSFGGCTKCYGKGYSTRIYGQTILPDFIGDKAYEVPPTEHIEFCSCDRGKALQKYGEKVREEEVEFLKRIKLEVDANVCSCGEEWKDTDIHDLISDRLTSLTKQEKGQR